MNEILTWECKSGKVYIGDLLYSKENTLGSSLIGGILNVMQGKWEAEVHSYQDKGERVQYIFTWNINVEPNNVKKEFAPFRLGISSSYAAICDNSTFKPYYGNWGDVVGTNILFAGDRIICRSGYGAGYYNVYVGKINGLISLIGIKFIDDYILDIHKNNLLLMNNKHMYMEMIINPHIRNTIEKLKLERTRKETKEKRKRSEIEHKRLEWTLESPPLKRKK